MHTHMTNICDKLHLQSLHVTRNRRQRTTDDECRTAGGKPENTVPPLPVVLGSMTIRQTAPGQTAPDIAP